MLDCLVARLTYLLFVGLIVGLVVGLIVVLIVGLIVGLVVGLVVWSLVRVMHCVLFDCPVGCLCWLLALIVCLLD